MFSASPCLRGEDFRPCSSDLGDDARCRRSRRSPGTPAIPPTRSQPSHFGVGFNSCCASRSRDQPIDRSPDFCLSPRLRGEDFRSSSFRSRGCRAISALSAIPGTPVNNPTRSHSSQFGVGFNGCASRSPDHPISRSPDLSVSPCLRGRCSNLLRVPSCPL
jgi:hypothetical protein